MRRFVVWALAWGIAGSALAQEVEPPIEAEIGADGLLIQFADSMQVMENHDIARLVHVTPAVPMSNCEWDGDTELYCTSIDDVKLATRYRVTLDPKLLRTAAGALLPAAPLVVESDRPALRANLAWEAGQPRISLTSEHRLSVEAARAALRLTVDGKPATVTLVLKPTKYDQSHFSLELPPFARESTVVLSIVPGLHASDGPLLGKQDETLLRAIGGEPFQMRGAVCAGTSELVAAQVRDGRLAIEGCTPDEPVRLFFSREPDQRDRTAWTARWPAAVSVRRFGNENSWQQRTPKGEAQRAPGWWIESVVDAPHARTDLSVPALHTKDGPTASSSPVAVTVGTGAARPAFVAPFGRALLLPGASAQLQAVNAPARPMHVTGLANAIETEITQTAPAIGDTPAPIASALAERTLRDGGLVEWRPRADVGASSAALMAAAPAFDVFAVAGKRQVIAWAHDWETGAPVARADVELLLQRSRDGALEAVATGRTDADGIASIALPADFVVPAQQENTDAPRWTVRVQHGKRRATQRAVLPIDGQPFGAAKTLGFGVSDRPLYRAGDTVHWRLWYRQRQGTTLVPLRDRTAMKMSLGERYENPIATWTTTPGADGTVTGDTVIPIHAPDGDYCIGQDVARYDMTSRVCFHVGTWRTQDLWMRARTPPRTVRDGDTIALDVEAGYYSGGDAAGAAIDRIEASLEDAVLEDAYPQWKDYSFARVKDSQGSYSLVGTDALRAVADAQGRAHVEVPVAFKDAGALPPFGTVLLTAETKLSDRESTVSNTVEVHYAQFARYVGLDLGPSDVDRPDADKGIPLRAVVVDARGREGATGAPIQVEVSYGPDWDGARTPLQTCSLVAGAPPRACAFDRTKTGYYRFVARSGDAAPVEIDQFHWSSQGSDGKPAKPKLEFADKSEDAHRAAGVPVRILIQQPASGVPVLLVATSDDSILATHVLRAQAGSQPFDFPTDARWPRSFQVRAFVRGGERDANLPTGFRKPATMESLSLHVQLDPPPRTAAPVTLAFAPERVAPAQAVRLVLRNTSDAQRNVTLAIVDDALRALGAIYLDEMDPAKAEAFAGRSWDSVRGFGFDGWNATRWRWLIPTPERQGERVICAPVSRDTASCDPVVVVGNGAVHPIDVSSVESTRVLTAEQIGALGYMHRDSTNVALAAPPAQSGGGELDSITVAGAGVRDYHRSGVAPPPEEPPVVFDEPSPVDVQAPPPAPKAPSTEARPGTQNPPRPDHGPALDLARVRTKFADTALWRTDIVLAPGETREIEFVAPDNLTRWRAVAWSDDGAADFAMAEATLEAGLPVEARLQSPVRIYPGDHARLAANVRHTAAQAVEAKVTLDVRRGSTVDAHPAILALPAQGQASFGVHIAPDAPGTLLVTAAAGTDAGRDAVAAPLEVASTLITAQRTQAGWIGNAPIALSLPTLPEGATDPRLGISLWRGNDALVHGWTEDLRDYPHRCWEQILSRAVAAALALERNDPAWPDAKSVVQEALDNAAVFQKDDGDMRYFAQAPVFGNDPSPQVPLTAWTVDAFALLKSLGHPVPADVDERARRFLTNDEALNEDDSANERAIAAAVVDRPADLAKTGKAFATLALPARVAAARALARSGDAQAADAFGALLANTRRRGEARVLQWDGGERWMSSPMREQCELIRLAQDYPQLAPADTRRALVAGLSDLYAGGAPEVDTQTGAICLRALHGERTADASPVTVDATVGGETQRLALRNGEVRTEATFEAPPSGTLQVAATAPPEAPVAYLARVDFNEDARHAQSTAIGFAIARQYEVLRDHKWTPLGDAPLRDNDWVRITLTVTNGRPRWFVAVTDDLPGGLRPMDLSLAGVAGVNVQALGDLGDWSFDQRKLDPRKPKFYAEQLPPGRHVIHYFARAANSGDYLAAPAVAELMYGEASRARTAADRVRIADPAPSGAAP